MTATVVPFEPLSALQGSRESCTIGLVTNHWQCAYPFYFNTGDTLVIDTAQVELASGVFVVESRDRGSRVTGRLEDGRYFQIVDVAPHPHLLGAWCMTVIDNVQTQQVNFVCRSGEDILPGPVIGQVLGRWTHMGEYHPRHYWG